MAQDSSAVPEFAGPLYRQVAAVLRAKICAREWTPRAPLPNEVVLARDAGVSIGTMRKALELLEDEHLIERRQGRGTFVVETSTETEVERFSNLVIEGRKAKADVIKWAVDQGAASAEEAQALRIAGGVQVYRLDGVWRCGKRLAVLEQVTVAQARFPGLENRVLDCGQFLFPLYRRSYNEVVAKVSESLTLGSCREAAAARLCVSAGTPCLEIHRLAYGLSGVVVEFARRTVLLGEARYRVMMD